MEINGLLKKYEDNFREGILILSKLLDVDKSYIYAYGERKISKEVEDKFLKMMEKRSSGYPLQYLLGEREFMGLDFYLEEGVLIPRPDTEILVEYIIEYIKRKYKEEKINFLELGIGSGAISLSVANYCKNVQVLGVDISDKAIKVANINKEKFNLSNVEFYKGDLFKGLDKDKKFNVIASNPPYIGREDIKGLDVQVKDFEPRLALDGGVDGLDFYRKITPKSKEFLLDKGILIYEIGYDQGPLVKEIMIKEGFKEVSIKKDLQGHDRIAIGFLID